MNEVLALALSLGYHETVAFERLFVDLDGERWERGVEPNPETAAQFVARCEAERG